jgi:hypothetical protein
MNHDPTPTSPADQDPSPNRRRLHDREEDNADHRGASPPPEGRPNGSASNPSPRRPELSQKAKDGLSKKLSFLRHLLESLDTLIGVEMCVLYYMEYVSSLLPPLFATRPRRANAQG